MLSEFEVMAMVPVKDLEESKKFYSETLGLNKVDENPGGVTYLCGKSQLFVYPTPTAGTAKSTVATWEVKDIAKIAKDLKDKGLEFEKYDYPDATHEGDVHAWKGMKAAWFRDPTGNILGLSEMA